MLTWQHRHFHLVPKASSVCFFRVVGASLCFPNMYFLLKDQCSSPQGGNFLGLVSIELAY